MKSRHVRFLTGRFHLICGVASFLIVGSHLAGQEAQSPDPIRPAESAEPGLWPSPKLIELMLARWAEEASHEYKLDDEQRKKSSESVVERWSTFLSENREEIQPLANEYLEMRMGLRPPDKDKVQEWARRARPVFDMVSREMDEGATEYRRLLRPDQRIRFEVDALQMKVGLGMARQRFSQWETGEFDAEDFWEPVGPDREARRDERRQRRREMEERRRRIENEKQAAEDAARDPIELEMDAWQRYVVDFISAHGLDAGQRETVLSCLTELRDRALAHRDRHREEIIRLEERVESNSGTESELADIKVQLERLYGPIDEMFRELQTRIDRILSADQRAEAVKGKSQPPPTKDVADPASSESP
jgi:hypothetical protein